MPFSGKSPAQSHEHARCASSMTVKAQLSVHMMNLHINRVSATRLPGSPLGDAAIRRGGHQQLLSCGAPVHPLQLPHRARMRTSSVS